MVTYNQGRDWATPADYPVGSRFTGTIIEVNEKMNERKYYHVIAEDANGKCLSFNVGDNISEKSFLGKIVTAIFGKKYIEDRKFTTHDQLKGQTINLLVTEYTTKYDPESGEAVHYPKVNVIMPSAPVAVNVPIQNNTVNHAPEIAPRETCDVCGKVIGDPLHAFRHEEKGEKYVFCSKACKNNFLG